MPAQEVEQLSIDTIRTLSMDAVQQANAGHPGTAMALAPLAYLLYTEVMRHSPSNPHWPDRDRFVLSAGHACILQYCALHLAGYNLSLEELRRFRQWGSATPGHPEYRHTPGVETTTGPLGQGFANAVGMALAEKVLAQRFNRPGFDVVDHRTWVFMGDGCLMEGISHEAASLAGTWGLGKLVAFWDDNHISIDGDTAGWFTDDTAARFEAYGWQVIRHVDGHDPQEIEQAIRTARNEKNKPTLICCRTTIGWGAPTKAGKESCHGAPLGKDEIAATRTGLAWSHEPFHVPPAIGARWDARAAGEKREATWNQLFDAYTAAHPDLAAELKRRLAGDLPAGFADAARAYAAKLQQEGPVVASRKASQMALDAFGPLLPELIGGSADLAHSNLTLWKGSKSVTTSDANANYVYYGVREFGMAAISNGLALHGGFIPYDATFLVFSDYSRNALRMSALIPTGAIHVFTHDSIGLGEDGPTHQPVEHLASLRYIPNNDVWRPCDAVESAVAWQAAIERRDGPSCLVFSRQNLAHQARTPEQLGDIARGGYVLSDPGEATFDVILVGTGSEVELAMEAARRLAGDGIRARVVSMPSTDVFDRQPLEWREAVLPSWCRARVAVEAGVTDYWRKYVGLDGAVVGIDTFGASAPAEHLYRHFGITADAVVAAAKGVAKR